MDLTILDEELEQYTSSVEKQEPVEVQSFKGMNLEILDDDGTSPTTQVQPQKPVEVQSFKGMNLEILDDDVTATQITAADDAGYETPIEDDRAPTEEQAAEADSLARQELSADVVEKVNSMYDTEFKHTR